MSYVCTLHCFSELWLDRLLEQWPGWDNLQQNTRYMLTGVGLFLAALTLLLTLLPTGNTSTLHHRSAFFREFDIEWPPYIKLRHESPPPF